MKHVFRSSRAGVAAMAAAMLLAAWPCQSAARGEAEALKAAMSGAGEVLEHRLRPSGGQRADMERKLGCRMKDVLAAGGEEFVLREGLKDGATLRYAMVLTARARSEAMKILVAMSAAGTVESVEILSFAEPPQYKANRKFMAQFEGMDAERPPRHEKNVRNLAGATITSRQTARAVHLALLLAEMHRKAEAHASAP